VEILMALPGRIAARFRKDSADVIVRYLGGDPSLVEEVAANRLIQERLPDEHPSRLFGQTVDSEGVKRAREELEVGRFKRACLEDLSQSVRLYFDTMAAIGVQVDDRDRIYAKDRLSTVMFGQQTVEAGDGEICISEFTKAAGYRENSVDCIVGQRAKKLYLEAHREYKFPKKTVFANGQAVQANIWKQSQRAYIERAIQQLQQEGKLKGGARSTRAQPERSVLRMLAAPAAAPSAPQ
jgi:hypothetical protein